MTLYEIIKIIEDVASEQPGINTIVPSDVYDLSSLKTVRYGAFAWTQNQHRYSERNEGMYYSLNLFYIDRLSSDDNNKVQIQSIGIEVLKNIIRTIQEYYDVEIYGDVLFETFTQSFADDCAGAFAKITFFVNDDNLCEEIYDK